MKMSGIVYEILYKPSAKKIKQEMKKMIDYRGLCLSGDETITVFCDRFRSSYMVKDINKILLPVFKNFGRVIISV